MRFELTTPTLARLCSTPELRPLGFRQLTPPWVGRLCWKACEKATAKFWKIPCALRFVAMICAALICVSGNVSKRRSKSLNGRSHTSSSGPPHALSTCRRNRATGSWSSFNRVRRRRPWLPRCARLIACCFQQGRDLLLLFAPRWPCADDQAQMEWSPCQRYLLCALPAWRSR